jgi:hypothetical protein
VISLSEVLHYSIESRYLQSQHKSAAHGNRILFMKKLWKVAAFVALAAIPLIILGKKTTDEKGLVPESGDESDIFDQELSAD